VPNKNEWPNNPLEGAGLAQKTKTLPLMTLITLIYADQERSMEFAILSSVSISVTFCFLCKAKSAQ
jgi:hypothetical protein